jgi:hypothetical protein
VNGRGTIALACAILGLAVAAPSAMAATRVVNDDAIPATCFGTPTTYMTIQAGVNAANPGDTVLVCPGLYNEPSVFVSTARVTVRGQFLPPDIGTCNATRTALNTAAALKKYSILNGGFFLFADKDTVDSMVLQGPWTWGIETFPGASGYVLQNNLVQDFVWGIQFDASGAIASREFNNCSRNNTDSGSFSPSLANASIQANHTFGNANVGISVNDSSTAPSKVTVQANFSANDFYGIEMDGSTTSSVQANIIKGTSAAGICLGFGNTGLLVQGNIITTALASHGVLVDGCPYSSGSLPNTGLKIQGNISTTGADGFDVPSNDALQNSKITGNIFKTTSGNAMWIEPTTGNFGNTFTGNVATATPGFFGCRDDTGPFGPGTAGTFNTWGDSNIGKPNNFPMTLCFPHK